MSEEVADSRWVNLNGGTLFVPSPPDGMIWKVELVEVRRGRVFIIRTPIPDRGEKPQKIDLRSDKTVG